MKYLERRKVLLLLFAVIAAAFIWYYFSNVYGDRKSMQGTLVENPAGEGVFCAYPDDPEAEMAA